ncbi:MAG TPA: hemolysin family protein [Stenomitos sp.]
MDVSSTSLNLFLVAFFTLLNGFFVAAEFAFVKVRPTRLDPLISEGDSRARAAQHILHHLDAYLSACQLGITLSSLALGALGEPAIARLIEPVIQALHLPESVGSGVAFALAFTIITSLHIVIGEQAPKSLAIRTAEATTLFAAHPLRLFHQLGYPIIWLMNGASNGLLRLLRIEPVSEHASAHTEEEIRILMKESAKSGLIDADELALFDKMFHFSGRVAREIMVPRVDMICLDRNDPFAENRAIADREQHTRYPVCNGSKDDIVGFIHIRDLFSTQEQNLDRLTRKIMAVPASLEISSVLKQMQKARAHLALVMDEYGGTAGMLTIEDILEEIVGDIQDEFDDERPSVEPDGDAYSIDGRVLLVELNERFGWDIEADEDSLGGWLYSQLGRAPLIGDAIEEEGLIFRITEVDHLRIVRVRMEPRPVAAEAEADEAVET